MARGKETPKSKEDRTVDLIRKVKSIEPWPDPPIKKLPSQQPDSKPTVNPAPAGKGSKTPAKKD